MSWVRLSFLAIGAVFCLELGLRLGFGLGDPPIVDLDEEVEYRLRPSSEYRRFGNRISINSHGMRAPDHPRLKSPEERRVLLVGDSVIYGNHFLDQSETIALFLSDELESTTSCTVFVMPAAASSWGPVNQAAFLDDLGTLGADMAIVTVSAHDLYDTPVFRNDVVPYRVKHSYGAIHDMVQILGERVWPSRGQQISRGTREQRARKTLEALDRIQKILTNDDVPITLAYHATVTELSMGLRPEFEVFLDWASENGHDFLSLSQGLSIDGYRDDIHPNVDGSKNIAKMFTAIAANKLNDCSNP